MARSIQIVIDGDVDYCWVGRTHTSVSSPTHLYAIGANNTLTLPEPDITPTSTETFKLTLYTYAPTTNIYQNKGTVLFRVGVPDKNTLAYNHKQRVGYTLDTQSVYLSPPIRHNERWDRGVETPVFTIHISVSLPFFVTDVFDEYKTLSTKIQHLSSALERSLSSTSSIEGCDNCEWFVRQSQMEYEWPFCMPGCTGIRQAGYGIPTMQMIDALVQHACALCGFSYDRFVACENPKQKENVLQALACVAMGAAGFSNGYSTEEADDTSTVWAAMGGDKDCEDFATACVSTINAIKRYSRYDTSDESVHPMTPRVIRYIRTEVAEAFVTAGWVQVNIQNYTGSASNTQNEGHAWCSIRLTDGTHRIIECTTPILPHKQAHETKNMTNAQHIFTLYGAAFNLVANHAVAKELGYGPAQLQPRDRYKAVAYVYSDTCGYAVCKQGSSKIVGVTAKDFIANNISLVPLASQEIQELIGPFRELDVNPDFIHTAPTILNDINLHTRDIRSLSTEFDIAVIPTMPTHSIRFIPVSQLVIEGTTIVGKLNLNTDGTTPICVWPTIISPTAHGFYIGVLHESTLVFNDITQ